jgi:acyl-CoA thioesterase
VNTRPDETHRPQADALARSRAVAEKMLRTDAFSRWLGIELVDVGVDRAVVQMTVRDDMVNGFGTSHGGVLFSLADTAFAYATNGHGDVSVAIDCTVSYPAAAHPGDVLTATAIQESSSRRLGFCRVTVQNQHGATVGHFRGTVYRTQTPHFPAVP